MQQQQTDHCPTDQASLANMAAWLGLAPAASVSTVSSSTSSNNNTCQGFSAASPWLQVDAAGTSTTAANATTSHHLHSHHHQPRTTADCNPVPFVFASAAATAGGPAAAIVNAAKHENSSPQSPVASLNSRTSSPVPESPVLLPLPASPTTMKKETSPMDARSPKRRRLNSNQTAAAGQQQQQQQSPAVISSNPQQHQQFTLPLLQQQQQQQQLQQHLPQTSARDDASGALGFTTTLGDLPTPGSCQRCLVEFMRGSVRHLRMVEYARLTRCVELQQSQTNLDPQVLGELAGHSAIILQSLQTILAGINTCVGQPSTCARHSAAAKVQEKNAFYCEFGCVLKNNRWLCSRNAIKRHLNKHHGIASEEAAQRAKEVYKQFKRFSVSPSESTAPAPVQQAWSELINE